MQVEKNLTHSFEKTNLDQTSMDASDNNPSSLVELVNVIKCIFGSVKRTSITEEEPCER